MTPEWKTWIMVTKSVLSSQKSLSSYTELKTNICKSDYLRSERLVHLMHRTIKMSTTTLDVGQA